uniref:Basement membrane-specific heparan sulfate proteoglycan core protein-like n=1 Tax=Saccoglossus kowalevskii TaxID=10224 RepID=A0ABM0MP99_SACKO
MVLADVSYIHIRASYDELMLTSALGDLAMETAIPRDNGKRRAVEVEQCSCPEGYMGLSCQSCSPGYSRTGGGLYLGLCVKCACNGHSTECDPDTGACVGCDHNTVGERCNECADGYYGDATAGTPGDCRKCACPLDIPSNQFSSTCFLDSDGLPTCLACRQGYTGRDCGQCAEGYIGEPGFPGGRCEKDTGGRLPPQVTVNPSRISDSVGATITFQCIVSDDTTLVTWSRADNLPLPLRARELQDHSLRISSIEASDEGKYVCVAGNNFGKSTAEGELSVISEGLPIQVIVDEPTEVQVEIGDSVTFNCRAISQVSYILAWTKKGDNLPPNADDFMGRLTIRNIRPEDTGTYICTGSNQYAVDTGVAQLTIGVSVSEPTVSIDPSYLRVNEGDKVEFRCTATGFPPPQLEWTGGQGGVLSLTHTFVNGLFTIEEATRSDEAEYFCKATNDVGTATVRTVLYVEISASPKVTIDPPTLSVTEGDQAVFLCTATGDPTPTVAWTKMNMPLPSTARERENGYLIISGATVNEAGDYRCTASNGIETAEDVARLFVLSQTRRIPSVSIEPNRQIVTQGSTAILRCITEGDPKPSITWSRAGGELTSNHQVSYILAWTKKGDNLPPNADDFMGRLTIRNIRPEDTGTYICTGSNQYAVDTGVAQLTIG